MQDISVADVLFGDTQSALIELEAMEREGYNVTDVGGVARDCAAAWERCLKRATGQISLNLNALIDALNDDGWVAAPALHTIRKAANDDKHSVDPSNEFEELHKAVTQVLAERSSLEAIRPNMLDDFPFKLRERKMVCAIYEFFTHGDTEYVFLDAVPTDTYRSAKIIDRFQIPNSHGKDVEAAMAHFEWDEDPPRYEKLRQSLESSDSELWQIATLTCSYADLQKLFSQLQHDWELLPGLHRNDEVLSVVASLVSSIVHKTAPATRSRLSDEAKDWISETVDRTFDSLPPGFKVREVNRCDRTKFDYLLQHAAASAPKIGLLIASDGTALVLA